MRFCLLNGLLNDNNCACVKYWCKKTKTIPMVWFEFFSIDGLTIFQRFSFNTISYWTNRTEKVTCINICIVKGQIVAVIGKNEKAINHETLCFPSLLHSSSRATKYLWLSGCEKQFTPNCFIVQQLATIWKAPALLARVAALFRSKLVVKFYPWNKNFWNSR